MIEGLRRWAGAVSLTISTVLVSGCGVELAMIGAAASAASSGSAVYKQGKLNASWMGSFDEVVTAGEVALSELGMHIQQNAGDSKSGEWKTVALDDQGDKIILKVKRQTPRVTEFQIDVGWFGNEPTARLVLKRMAVAINLDANADGTGDVLPTYAPTPVEHSLSN